MAAGAVDPRIIAELQETRKRLQQLEALVLRQQVGDLTPPPTGAAAAAAEGAPAPGSPGSPTEPGSPPPGSPVGAPSASPAAPPAQPLPPPPPAAASVAGFPVGAPSASPAAPPAQPLPPPPVAGAASPAAAAPSRPAPLVPKMRVSPPPRAAAASGAAQPAAPAPAPAPTAGAVAGSALASPRPAAADRAPLPSPTAGRPPAAAAAAADEEDVESIHSVFEVRSELSEPATSLSSTSVSDLLQRRRAGSEGGSSMDFSDGPDARVPRFAEDPAGDTAAAAAASAALGRSRSRSSASHVRLRDGGRASAVRNDSVRGKRAAQLETVLPEECFLDTTRMDIDRVIGCQEEFRGAFMPHFMTWAFDEGTETQAPEPGSFRASDEVIGKVESVLDNISRRKEGGSCVRYNIYVLERMGDRILDCGTRVCLGDGTFLGHIVCIFGSVNAPRYVVQDTAELQQLPDGEETDTTDLPKITPRAAEGTAVHTVTGLERVLASSTGDSSLYAYHVKGCDASTFFDDELPPERHEFSDDEAERQAKERKRKRPAPGAAAGAPSGEDSDGDGRSSSCASSFSFNEDGEITRVRTTAQEKRRRKEQSAAAARAAGMPPPPRPGGFKGKSDSGKGFKGAVALKGKGGAAGGAKGKGSTALAAKGSRAHVAAAAVAAGVTPPPRPPQQQGSGGDGIMRLHDISAKAHPIASRHAQAMIQELQEPCKVYLSQVPLDLPWHQLGAIVSAAFGGVEEVIIKENKKKQGKGGKGDPKGMAFITFSKEESATLAVRIGSLYSPQGQRMEIRRAHLRRPWRQGSSAAGSAAGDIDSVGTPAPSAPPDPDEQLDELAL